MRDFSFFKKAGFGWGCAFSVISLLLSQASASTLVSEEDDPRIPAYTKMHPTLAVGVNFGYYSAQVFSLSSADFTGATGGLLETKISFEFQPEAFKRFGLLGIGPALSIFTTTDFGYAFTPAIGFLGLSVQATYQARFWRDQFIVPVGFFSGGMARYALTTASTGMFSLIEYGGGAEILLNTIDRDAANQFYTNYSILRTYLTGVISVAQGSGTAVAMNGRVYVLGLRFEY